MQNMANPNLETPKQVYPERSSAFTDQPSSSPVAAIKTVHPDAGSFSDSESDPLRTSYDECRRIMKNRAVSFYQAFRLLPLEVFLSIQAIYAFCRYVDDVTDQTRNPEEAYRELNRMEEILRAVFAKQDFAPDDERTLSTPWLPAFIDTVAKYDFSLNAFLSQIRGQRRDLEMRDMETMDELLEYCENVAGSVGLMLMPILALPEARSEKLERACLDLGIGMQLTNILRDVGEDITQRNRVYLPAELLSRHGLKRRTLMLLADRTQKPVIPEEFEALWEEIAAYSAPRYKSILDVIGDFRPEARLPLLSAALLYQGIEDAVRNNGFNCFTKRCYPRTWERGQCITKAKKLLKRLLKNND